MERPIAQLEAQHLALRRDLEQLIKEAEKLPIASVLRAFRVCTLVKEATRLGCVIHPVRLTQRQRDILHRLQFPTPAQTLSRRLPPYPRE